MEIEFEGRKYPLRGWIPSRIQKKDPQASEARRVLAEKTDTRVPKQILRKVDLRPFFPPVYDQGNLGSCTAQAAAGALEYYQRRWYLQNRGIAYSKTPSRLFIYKHNRMLMGVRRGDTGSTIKHTMQALHRFGAPEEDFKFGTEYNVEAFDREYEAAAYALASRQRVDAWYNYDGVRRSGKEILRDVKRHLAVGQPVMFGFIVFKDAITEAAKTGYVKYPEETDTVLGGHAVLAVGYNDRKGALIFRNSWSEAWGDRGYGYLDYKYVKKSLAVDFWSVIKIEMFSEIDFEDNAH